MMKLMFRPYPRRQAPAKLRRAGLRRAALIGCALALAACSSSALSAAPEPSPTVQISLTINQPSPTPEPTITPQPAVTPEPTVSPLAARVNGQEITKEALNAELLHYLAADPANPSPDTPEGREMAAQMRDGVLDTMIEQALIEQAAAGENVAANDDQVSQEIEALITIRGGRDSFDAWLAANRQTEQDLRDMVRHELIATAMRDRIVAQLPYTAEYIHACHIVVAREAEAQSILDQLNRGARFADLARAASTDDSTRPNGGDLGWFTRGSGAVLWTEVEDAAFALQPGQTSDIVKSPIGYHIIRVTERQTRALTSEDAAYFQQAALRQWIEKLKAKATIETF